jgi:uncharacterized membrane protein YtjA (UPF0391 family)
MNMMKVAAVFLVLAALAKLLDLNGFVIASALTASVLFSIFSILFLIFLVLGFVELIAAKRKLNAKPPVTRKNGGRIGKSTRSA